MIYNKCLSLLQIKLVGEQCVSFCALCSVRSHWNCLHFPAWFCRKWTATLKCILGTQKRWLFILFVWNKFVLAIYFPLKCMSRIRHFLVGEEHKFRQITLSKIFQIQNSPVSQFTYSLFHNGTYSCSKFKEQFTSFKNGNLGSGHWEKTWLKFKCSI